ANLFPYLEAARNHAEKRKSRGLLASGIDGNVIRAGNAAADAFSPGVPKPREVSGAPGDGQIERRAGENERLPVGAEPWTHHVDDAVAEHGRLEHAAVKEYRIDSGRAGGVSPLILYRCVRIR